MKLKRVLPLALSLLMAGGAFAGLAGCNSDGGGSGGGPAHEHAYTGWHDNGDGTHSPKCTSTTGTCDTPVKTLEKEGHEYGGVTDTTCDKCGATDPHSHDYQWKDNGDGTHSQKCQGAVGTCRVPVDGEPAFHVYDNAKDATCNSCDYERNVPTGDETSTALPAGKKIYVVGDSTGCDYAAKGTHEDVDKNAYYVVRYGFGTQLHEYLNVEESQVVNLALSGRSSKSFLTEENYTTLTSSIGAGDYLIIAFGHNDQKQDTAFYTNPNLATDDATTTAGSSFKYTLYEKYIKMAEDKGAQPILMTPIVRYNKDSSKYSNSASGHITANATVSGVTYAGGDYAQAIRDLATEKNVPLLDLTAITKQLYMTEGEGALQYHAYRTYKLGVDGTTKTPANPDATHLNELGAKMVAYQMAQALKTAGSGLEAHVKTCVLAPTYNDDFRDRINSSYVKPTATPFDPANKSTLWTNVTEEGWYGTVFGDVGGQNKIAATNFKLSASGGTFTLDCEGQGKFASTTEGIAAIFKQIDATKDFTAEVTATVTDSAADNQTSFGLMLRDDIYIDKSDSSILSNYVAAGILNGGAVFAMDTEVRQATNGSATISKTSTYKFKIVKSGTSITATVTQDGTPISHTYTDISLTTSDKNNVYLCMYAIRKIAVSFTNVTVTISE